MFVITNDLDVIHVPKVAITETQHGAVHWQHEYVSKKRRSVSVLGKTAMLCVAPRLQVASEVRDMRANVGLFVYVNLQLGQEIQKSLSQPSDINVFVVVGNVC